MKTVIQESEKMLEVKLSKVDREIMNMFLATNQNQIERKPPSNKPSKYDLKEIREKAFNKVLKRLNKVDCSRLNLLKKFYKEIGGVGGGHHKRFMKAIDIINWRMDLIIQDDEDYNRMMETEIERILEKD